MTLRQHSNTRTCAKDGPHQRRTTAPGRIFSLHVICHGARPQSATSSRGPRHPPARALLLRGAAGGSCCSGQPGQGNPAPAAGQAPRASPSPSPSPSPGHDAEAVEASTGSRLLQSVVAALSAASLLAGSVLVPGPALARPRLTPEEKLTIEIFKRSTPSVVNVTNLAVKRDAFTMNMLEMPQGQGSGFIWDSSGHVVTNYHVIQDASDIKVTLANGDEFSAKVVGVDQDKDIAVLQIGPIGPQGELLAAAPALQPVAVPAAAAAAGAGGSGGAVVGGPTSGAAETEAAVVFLEPLSLCSSSADIVVGQKVFAIGNPFGLDHTLTVGVVSGTGREIQSISGRPIQDVIQTDAAINPGNSGGPLLDSGGCLIGINTAIYSPTGANNGVGFAIPVDIVKSSVGQIIQYGKVTRPVLGISFAPDGSSEALGIKAGILVLSAREGGPAWKAGLKGSTRDEYGRLVLGDIITAVNGVKIKSSSDLYRVLDKAQVGDTLRITVLRENSTFQVEVTLEASSPPGPQGTAPLAQPQPGAQP